MKLSKEKPVICILGGMGPQASSRLLSMIIEKFAVEGCVDSDDFPEVVVDSIPVPDFISDLKNREIALGMLKKRIRLMNAFEPDCFAVACNTAHILLDELKTCSRSHFVSIIDEVFRRVVAENIKTVGLLASPTTINMGLFQKAFGRIGIKVVKPDKTELDRIDCVIRRVISGRASKRDVRFLVTVARRLKKRGAEGIILGCTELPLVFPRKFELLVFNSLEILADALVLTFYLT